MPSSSSRRPDRPDRPGRRGSRSTRSSARPASRTSHSSRPRARRSIDPLLGHTIAGHRLLERVATDPVCNTYKANHAAMARLVAFKALTAEAAADADTLARFLDTAKAAAQLHHPSIASIYDVGTALNVHFCTLEYVEGRSVAELLRARQKITSDDALRVALNVAEALRFANAKEIPGFRLSADRVVLSSRGEVKVFPPALTPPKAPVLDDGYVLAAVGVLLYAMVSGGRVPDLEAALEPGSAAARQLPPIKQAAMGTRQDIAAVVDRLLGTSPDGPYPSVEVALAALRDLLQKQERAESRTRSATERARERKKRGLVGIIAAVSVGLVFLVLVGGLLLSQKAKRDALRRAFVEARQTSDATLEDGKKAWTQFYREPSPQAIQAAAALYERAKQPYLDFQARYPHTAQAQQAGAWIHQIDKALVEQRQKAADHLRDLEESNALKALKKEFDSEVARKLEQGGTLDLAQWRTRYLELLKQFPRSAYIAAHVEHALRNLPQRIELEQMRIEANQLDRDFAQKYYPEHEYAKALADIEAFRKKYDPIDHLRKEMLINYDRLKTKVDMVARTNIVPQMNQASHLASQGKYDRARQIYQRIIRNYSALNRRKFVDDARAALDKLPKP